MHARNLAALVTTTLLASTALADPPPKRAMPVYDGRAEAPVTAADIARGVGRVVLYPIYLVVNYGVRWPVGKLVQFFESSKGVRKVVQTLFLGPPTPTLAIFPIAFYDFGFKSSIGVRMLWNNGFATPGSAYSLKLGFGGKDFWRGDGQFRFALPAQLFVQLDLQAKHRPDQVFYGVGSRTPEAAKSRFQQGRFAVEGSFGFKQLMAFVGTSLQTTGPSTFGTDPSIDQAVDEGLITELPAGYKELLVTNRAGARIHLDSRHHRLPYNSGARFDATVERASAEHHGAWWHVDATLGGALRLDRVGEYSLDLRVRLELIEAPQDVDVPFLELASVGGSRDLRGFVGGRGRDKSAVAVTLDYQWPLAAWLDATMYVGAGNVFGEQFSGLYAGKLRGSFGLGIALAGISDERQIELWSAVGTDPFDEGFTINSFRLVLAYAHDY